MLEWVEAEPDITMPELATKLKAEKDVTAHPVSLSRVLLKAGLSFKKRHCWPWKPSARTCARRVTMEGAAPAAHARGIHRLVFFDETGTTTKMTAEFAALPD